MKSHSESLFKELLYSLGYVTSASIELAALSIDSAASARREALRKKDGELRLALFSAHVDTQELYENTVTLQQAANFPDPKSFVQAVADRYSNGHEDLPTYPIVYHLFFFADQLYRTETLASVPNPMLEVAAGRIEAARYRDRIFELRKRIADPPLTIETLSNVFLAAFEGLHQHLPHIAFTEETESAPTIPLIDILESPGKAVLDLILPFFAPTVIELGLFASLRKRLEQNQSEASGKSDQAVSPVDFKGTPQEIVHAYLKDTPLENVFSAAIPFSIPERVRFEHTHVLGGSGHGKSTLLTQQFLSDVLADESPGLIVIDGKGTFVSALQKLALFAPDSPLSKRLIILNPQDPTPPALNIFAPPIRDGEIPEDVRRQVENSAIALFEYIFAAKEFALTAKQTTCLSYCARLLFSMKPTPTIHTLLDLMSGPVSKAGGVPASSMFAPFIELQPPIVKRFFTDLFFHPTEYGETKRQIQNRIFDLLENPAFSAMFSTAERKIDLFDVIQNRKILLVDSSPSALGENAAPLLGRYIIALALSSAYGRLAMPKDQWTPAYLIVDEAQMFVDEDKTQPLLQQAREFNLGVTLAHQKLADLTPTLVATFAANTSIRYVGGVSAADASFMAKNMNCEPEFIMGQRKAGGYTHFATYVRGFTERPLSLSIPLGILDKQPKMTAEAYERLIVRNRAQVAATPHSEPRVKPSERVEPVTEPAPPTPNTTHSEGGETY